METKNYTLGRGKLYFSRFLTGTNQPSGFFYFGNTPEFNLTIEQETLDHYSSDEGIREKDDSIPLQVNRTGSFTTDNIQPENVALFFFGVASTVTTASATAIDETLSAVKLDHYYRFGSTTANPVGYMGVENVVVMDDTDTTTYVLGTDYELDATFGTIKILGSGTIAAGDDLHLTYDVKASTRDRVISGSSPVEGALMYKANNPKGKQFNYYMPYIKVSPNGDYALKSDEWQTIPFTLDIQKLTTAEAIYMDGNPVFA